MLLIFIIIVIIILVKLMWEKKGKRNIKDKCDALHKYTLLAKLSRFVMDKTRNLKVDDCDKLHKQSLFFREYLIWYIHKNHNNQFMNHLANNQLIDSNSIRRTRREMKNIIKCLNYICEEKIKINSNIKTLSARYVDILKKVDIRDTNK